MGFRYGFSLWHNYTNLIVLFCDLFHAASMSLCHVDPTIIRLLSERLSAFFAMGAPSFPS